MAMLLQATRTIEAPASAAWDLLVDTQAWPRWGPSLRDVDAPHRHIELGDRGRVRLPGGFWLPFEITHLQDDEPRRCWRWRIGPVDATSHEVVSLGPERCSVAIGVPAMAWPYLAVCRLALRRLARLAEAS